MKKQLLLPRKCRLAGAVLLPFAIALLIACYHYDFSIPFLVYHPDKSGKPVNDLLTGPDFVLNRDFSADLTGTMAMVVTFVSLFMVAFSREKQEDEYVGYMRLRALQISVYANYIILFITALTLFGSSFLMVMEVNLFTILILFILVFNYNIRIRPRLSKSQTA